MPAPTQTKGFAREMNPLHSSQGLPDPLPLITQIRRESLLKHIDLSRRGLELGPNGRPTLFKAETDIYYLDWKNRQQLVAECAYPDQVDSIPEIDYVVSSNNYQEVVRGTFNHVIANHVLEHVPNLIQWLINIAALLDPGGILFLALPDKKFTFDKFRPNTRLSHILAEFYDGTSVITNDHFLEAEIFYDLGFLGQPMVVSERLNRARLEAMLARGPHIGYHCHIFDSETVLDTIFKPIFWMGYVDFDIVDFVPAKLERGAEMLIVCRKTAPRQPDATLDLPTFYRTDFEPPSSSAGEDHPPSEDIEGLRQRVALLEYEKRALLASHSWRITRPFRWISDKLK